MGKPTAIVMQNGLPTTQPSLNVFVCVPSSPYTWSSHRLALKCFRFRLVGPKSSQTFIDNNPTG